MIDIAGYKLIKCLDEGISSDIYRAIRIADGRPVVIKVNAKKIIDEGGDTSFYHEYEMGRQINSSYVVHYLELKQTAGYGVALVMEDDDAVTLSSCIPRQGFSDSEFLSIAIQIVHGLQAIHDKNIIHNDIKTSNIIISHITKAIKIIDFNQATYWRQRTQPGVPGHDVTGSLAYLAPEKTGRVNRSFELDHRSDLYSLGITFYQLLCGTLPFKAADTMGLIHQHIAVQPMPPHQYKSTISQQLSHIILKLLQKEAEKRYQSAEGLLYDLNYCLLALNETGAIPEFKLGEKDFSNKLILSSYLYGREAETKTLLAALERISQGAREVLMVTGQPGVGKSILIQEIQKSITLKKGYFLTGKFDQFSKNIAYSALIQAFDTFIKRLLTEDETTIAHWKDRLLEALDSKAQLIVEIIPILTSVIGPQPTVIVADPYQAKKVFNLVFQSFISVFANINHPLVIFLDDLQWADDATLDILTYLMRQPKTNYLLLIGAYRDAEVFTLHPALKMLNELKQEGETIQTLTLAALKFVDLHQWLTDSLHMGLTETHSLAKIIQQKTGGNPFFIKLFLQSLYDTQLLNFSLSTQWHWDTAKIQQHPATENVITFMSYQLQRLPYDTQEALNIISCLGNRIALNTLQIAMAGSRNTVYDALRPALNNGILIEIDDEVVFAHDRVQEASYSLLAEVERANRHLIIGRRLLTNSTHAEVLLFDIVAQFNHSHHLVTDLEERKQLGRLNLKAAQKAKQATAYTVALIYLYASKEWNYTETHWKTDYSLIFTLFKELAETEYLCGHFELSQALIATMQPYLQSTLDKIDIYYFLIIQKTLQGQFKAAIEYGLNALQLLGSELPVDNLTNFTQQKLEHIQKKLANTPSLSLLNYPIMDDPQKKAALKIINILHSPCYITSPKEMHVVTILMGMHLSLEYGNNAESCLIYVRYGYLLCNFFQKYELGYAFATLAIQLAEQLQAPIERCKSSLTKYLFVHPWSKPIYLIIPEVDAGFKASLNYGDLTYAAYYSALKIWTLLDIGVNLKKIQQEATVMLQFTQSIKHHFATYINVVQRVAANLVANTPAQQDFTFNTIDEIAFEEIFLNAKNYFPLCVYRIYKAQVLYLHHDIEHALQVILLAEKDLIYIPGIYPTALFNWYQSLIYLALYQTVPRDMQASYLKQVMQNQQQMRLWQASCPENFTHKYLLVEAELACIKGDYPQAEIYYDQAIKLAMEYGFIQEQALAAELAAKYWLMRDKLLCAKGYLLEAFNNYKQWGAKRKALLLKEKYPDLLRVFTSQLTNLIVNPEITLSVDSLRNLDLTSILKASQAISSEIELSKLLHKMMNIIIENAGAQKGAVLFLEKDGSIFVQAEYLLGGQIITLQNIPLIEWTGGAHSVIQYIKRQHHHVVINNAITHESFYADPYISKVQAKSILCLPILKQDRLTAILYVENNLMSHAFTTEHVQIVLILMAQMAISLENAHYFTEQIALTRQLAKQSARAKIAEESLHAVTHDLELALHASKAGTWNWLLSSDKMTLDSVNYALFGLTPETFTGTYEGILAQVHPADRETVDSVVRQCIESGTAYNMEYRIIWPDSSEHVISAHGSVYRDNQGKPIKMAGVCLDVTQRKQLEQERLEAIKKAEEEHIRRQEALNYQKKLEEDTHTICHELRNPLQGLIGSTQLLKTEIDSHNDYLIEYQKAPTEKLRAQLNVDIKNCKDTLNNLEESNKHLEALLDDILNLAKLDAHKMELVSEPFQPRAIIDSVIKMFKAKTAQKQLQLLSQIPEEEVWVKGDEKRLKQIIINLLANALKFTELGSITLGFNVQQITATHTQLRFTVEDTGIGMNAEEKSKLFQRFSQASANVSNQYGGTGLGLEISEKLVKLMQGQIEVTSEKDKGTTFSFTITCENFNPQELKDFAPQTTQPSNAAITELHYKILVVDDNVINQKVLTAMLKKQDHSVQIANDGLEAVQLFTTAGPFDLIFMDMEMPIMYGDEATRQIRQKESELHLPPIPIICTSARTSDELLPYIQGAGMNDFLIKPFKKEDVTRVIQAQLGHLVPGSKPKKARFS